MTTQDFLGRRVLVREQWGDPIVSSHVYEGRVVACTDSRVKVKRWIRHAWMPIKWDHGHFSRGSVEIVRYETPPTPLLKRDLFGS